MADVKQQRKAQVQILRRIAKDCGLHGVRDDASKAKIIEMAEAIAGLTGRPEETAEAAAAYEVYLSTFVANTSGSNAADGKRAGFRMRGKSFLLTYNWDFFGTALPDGAPTPATNKDLWDLWREWRAQKKKELQVKHSSSTLEQSLRSKLDGRVHLHWKIDLAAALDQTTTDNLAFHGVHPQVETTNLGFQKKARGANQQMASNRGHFYAYVDKIGSVYRGSNWKPFDDYRVYGPWIEDLWTQRKLDHETYRKLSLEIRLGHTNRKRDIEQVCQDERERDIDAKIVEVDAVLATLTAPFRVFKEVREWEDSFLHVAFRYKILVLVADSASGKSNFAESLFDNPYILTVEDSANLDLRGFDAGQNDGIVLDNVNSWGQLLSWRAILQARNAKSRGGQSATNVYAYPQYLYGVAIVATLDLDTKDSFLVDAQAQNRSRWLLKNCVFVRLPEGEAYYQKDKVPTKLVKNRFSLFAATVKRRRQNP